MTLRFSSPDMLPPAYKAQAEKQLRDGASGPGSAFDRVSKLTGPTTKTCKVDIIESPPKRKNKYSAKAVRIDDIRFDSTAEGKRYAELKQLQQAGEVIRFHRQVIFDLPGGTQYRVDFQIFWTDGRVTYEDVKGVQTETFRLKRRQVRALYNVEIEIP